MNQTVSYYDEHAEEYCASTLNADMSFCRDAFLSYLKKGAHILDCGCGSGRDSRAFLDAGFKVTAMDASAGMCANAEKLLGQDVLNISFEEINFQDEFDGIWSCASLLHVAKNKIGSVMEKLKTALKPGGILYASFKYGTEERESNGRLFNDYDETTLTQLLHDAGFLVRDIFITEDVRADRPGERWVNVLAWYPDMTTLEIDGTNVKIYRHGHGSSFYIGMSEREYDSAYTLVELLEKDHDLGEYNLIMYQVSGWNSQFSPWPAKAAFGDEDFTGEGKETLHWLTDNCIPKLLTDGLILDDVPMYTCGYSLSGLFALWACMESDKFDGAVCCSGSLWIDGWMDYLNAKAISHDMNIYLSLGSKEERSKNPMLSRVGDCTRETYEHLKRNPSVKNITLQWNKGGHFADANKRLASGIKWNLKLMNTSNTSQEIDLESKNSQENNKKKIIMLIKSDPSITQAKIAQQFGLTRAEVRYIMDQLQQNGILKREGSIKKGKWIIEKLI